ncbi:2'-5' RNA ligase family protein [Solwaraspora sp. WMMD406]|uniref:2'-5' RNA ligase family protein n=1 Tax=Solwaraspora sp. WMMD406 TaxID=3016095 RepID=UPI002415F0F2|nr:2'-5' RNA ligase family protein [Solwaraspora sp. WMMD406]MDG4768027.1 2'-5' RNA ligase family protein [Solwaraspora sp. WMMD406]
MTMQPGALDHDHERPWADQEWTQFQRVQRMVNHWDRPGWTPGRRSYHWMVMLGHVPALTAMATHCQEQLRDLPHLDLVPIASLHITMQRLAFTDEVSPDVAAAVVNEVRRRCADLPAVPIEIGPLAGSPGAVRFSVGPPEPVSRLRNLICGSIAEVCGNAALPERASRFVPHVSIAYHNTTANAQPLIQRVASLRHLRPVTTVVQSVDLVELRREGHQYIASKHAGVSLTNGPLQHR